MADAMQMNAVNRAIEELRDRVVDARAAYGEIPAVQRLVNDVERIRIDARELDSLAPAASPPTTDRIPIDDTPLDPSMWTDADDEGVGGFHGPHTTQGAPRGTHGTHR